MKIISDLLVWRCTYVLPKRDGPYLLNSGISRTEEKLERPLEQTPDFPYQLSDTTPPPTGVARRRFLGILAELVTGMC